MGIGSVAVQKNGVSNRICIFSSDVVSYRTSGIRRKLHQMILCCHWEIRDRREGDDMEIGIIGAGKVGCSMGKYMKEHGHSVAGFYSRSARSSEEAGTFTGTKAFEDLKTIVAACDLLFVAVPDDDIGAVWQEIRRLQLSLEGKILCHFSGSLSSAVFSGIEDTGASACSIHPMSAFSDKFTSYQQLQDIYLTMEGMEIATQVVGSLFRDMGNKVLTIAPETKALYHCSASLVSNFMIGLYEMGLELLEQCGIDEEDARALTTPLVANNIQAMLEKGPSAALTGPIERGDVKTVEKHLDALGDSAEGNVYRDLGQYVLHVAERKNPDREYMEIANVLSDRNGDRT